MIELYPNNCIAASGNLNARRSAQGKKAILDMLNLIA